MNLYFLNLTLLLRKALYLNLQSVILKNDPSNVISIMGIAIGVKLQKHTFYNKLAKRLSSAMHDKGLYICAFTF